MNLQTLYKKPPHFLHSLTDKLSLPIILLILLLILTLGASALGYVMGRRTTSATSPVASDPNGLLNTSVTLVGIDKNLQLSPHDSHITKGGLIRWTNNSDVSLRIDLTAHDYSDAFNQSFVIDADATGEYRFFDSGLFSYYITPLDTNQNNTIPTQSFITIE